MFLLVNNFDLIDGIRNTINAVRNIQTKLDMTGWKRDQYWNLKSCISDMLPLIHLFTPSQGILGDPSGVLGSCTPAKARKLLCLKTPNKNLNEFDDGNRCWIVQIWYRQCFSRQPRAKIIKSLMTKTLRTWLIHHSRGKGDVGVPNTKRFSIIVCGIWIRYSWFNCRRVKTDILFQRKVRSSQSCEQ